MNEEPMRMALRVTKALADVQRARILMMLRAGELCVCQIAEVLGLAMSTVSKHLSILDGAGLVESRKDGRWMFYRLPEGKAGEFVRPVLEWLGGALQKDEQVRRDAKQVQRVVACDPERLCQRIRRRQQ